MTDGFSYYELLGLEPDASTAEVKAAYRSSMRRFHPDVGGNNAQASLFQRAYEVLSDPAQRRDYDAHLSAPSATAAADASTPADTSPNTAASDAAWGVDDVWEDDPPGSTKTGGSDEATSGPATPPPGGPSSSRPMEGLATVSVLPPFDAGRKAYLVAVAIWGALWIGTLAYLASSGTNGFMIALVLLLGVVAAPPHWFDALPIVRIVGIVDLVVVMLISVNRGDEEVAYLVWAGLVGCGLVAVACLAWAWSRTARLNRAVDRQAVFEHNQWGDPGGAETRSSRDSPHQFAARATDQALGPLYATPGVKILHGLPWPGVPEGIVDHVVVAGNRVAVLQSQALPPGEYRADGTGALLRDGGHFLGGQTWVESAAAGWQQQLPGAVVKPFLVGHPMSGGRVRFAQPAGSAVECATAADLAQHVRQFLGPAAGVVDRAVMSKLLAAPT